MKSFFKMTRRGAFVVLAFALALFPLSVYAVNDPGERPRNTPSAPMPFEPHEQLIYEGEFSKLLLRGIKIAEFRFTAERANEPAPSSEKTSAQETQGNAPKVKDAAEQLLLVGDVTSAGWFHKLFNIDFHFRIESLVEREGFAVLRTFKLDEQGKRVRQSEAVFDRAAKKISWTEVDPNDPKRPPRVVTSPLEGTVHDILSAIYFLRTQPLTPGKNFELILSDSGQVYRVPATVKAEPKLQKTALGKVKVVRIDVELFGKGRPVEGEGKMTLWITDDARRIPVRARMSSDIGMLDIKLKRVTTTPAAEAKSK